jgi:hypothetical protein
MVLLKSTINAGAHRQGEKITRFLDDLKCHDKLLTEFDEKLWLATVDLVTFHSESEMAVTFKDGSEVTVEI